MAETKKTATKAAPKAAGTKKAAAPKAAKKAEVKETVAPTKKEAAYVNRVAKRYKEEVVPALIKKFGYTTPMQAPRFEKIVINIGVGDATQNGKALEDSVNELTTITGQRPVITKAKKSIATFKLREGQAIGCKVTLRGNRMYEFYDKLVSIALPRVRDFRGVSDKAFDGRGNYALGIREQLLFPEIDYDKVEKVRGMEMIFVTTAHSDEECKEMLRLMGMPFTK